jgi:hypothetical protein
VVSVEHVMPQQPAPNSQWLAWVPDKAVHQAWVHRLGNLALLSRKKNSAASNRDFAWKKTSYFTKGGTTAFTLTTHVLQFNDWTPEVMQQRQSAMLAKLEAHWRLQDRKSKADLAEALLAELVGAADAVIFEMESSRHGLSATAQESGGEFIVLAGSQAKLDWTGQPHTYQELRDHLRNSGALRLSEDETHLVFSVDTKFKRPSAASATVLGRTDNGRNTWRLKGSSITYAAWQDNLPNNQVVSGLAED